jgi:hypothetical protein
MMYANYQPMFGGTHLIRLALGVLICCVAGPAFAHGGRTNAEGCHNDRKRGEYHCHGGSSYSAPSRFIDSYQTQSSPKAKKKSKHRKKKKKSRKSKQAFAPVFLKPANTTWSYRNYSEARASGAAPVYFGEAGYGAHLDRDSDGIGCERR